MLRYESRLATEPDNLGKSVAIFKVRLFKDIDLEKNILGLQVW